MPVGGLDISQQRELSRVASPSAQLTCPLTALLSYDITAIPTEHIKINAQRSCYRHETIGVKGQSPLKCSNKLYCLAERNAVWVSQNAIELLCLILVKIGVYLNQAQQRQSQYLQGFEGFDKNCIFISITRYTYKLNLINC